MTVRAAIDSALHPSSENPESHAKIDQIIGSGFLEQGGRNWIGWAGPCVSVCILVAAAIQLRTIDLQALLRLLPVSPGFWLSFAAYYLAGPASEWVIFRRVWRLPIEGFGALLRKMVSNEILLGYLGEVYFYAWARRNAHITTAPFGAIKDVAILSALTGNVVTLGMVIVTAPLFGALALGMNSTAFVASAIAVLLSSLAMLLLRKRLFTLPRRDCWFVAGVHLIRIAATIGLAAVMWHLLLPAVGLSWWLLLGTLRQLLSRLPFLPNKDVVFAGLASFLVGPQFQIVAAIALVASLVLGANLLVGAGLGISELAKGDGR